MTPGPHGSGVCVFTFGGTKMTLREVRSTGLEALQLATKLLQQMRLADSVVGVWEAADMQWAWRIPHDSDHAPKVFWLDGDVPVAGILFTGSGDNNWQYDPVIVPNTAGITPAELWTHTVIYARRYAPNGFEIPISDTDSTFTNLARVEDLVPGYRDSTAWMHAEHRPVPQELPEGFLLVDRTDSNDTPHPMMSHNGAEIEQRLRQCSLYDPSLDLAVVTDDGQVAGYSLYWFDPITRVGLVEPMRVHDAYQRRGIARAMLTEGLARLTAYGAERIKVSYGSETAGALYTSVGFKTTSTTTWYELRPS